MYNYDGADTTRPFNQVMSPTPFGVDGAEMIVGQVNTAGSDSAMPCDGPAAASAPAPP